MTRNGRGTRVSADGDTFKTPGRTEPVDACEKDQQSHAAVQRSPGRPIEGKTVDIATQARDGYLRSGARVTGGPTSVSGAMKKHGG